MHKCINCTNLTISYLCPTCELENKIHHLERKNKELENVIEMAMNHDLGLDYLIRWYRDNRKDKGIKSDSRDKGLQSSSATSNQCNDDFRRFSI